MHESGDIAARLRAAGVVSEQPRSADAAAATTRDLAATMRGATPADARQLIAGHARQCAAADLGLVVRTAVGDLLVVDAADGQGADLVRGVARPAGVLWRRLVDAGEVIIDDAGLEQEAADLAGPLRLGPLLMVPLSAGGRLLGAVVLARLPGRPTFTRPEVQAAAILADYAALALAWAEEFRQREDRDSVADDLHDVVLGRLFATGLRLQAIPVGDLGGTAPIIVSAAAELDRAMADIRAAISNLRHVTVPPLE